jgi:hypothetical protein
VIAAPIAAISATPAPAVPLPDGTYRYATAVAGRPVGNSTIVVRRTGNVVTIAENGTLAGNAASTLRRLDASTFATLSYAIDYDGKHASVSVAGSEATLTQGTDTSTIDAALGTPLVINDNLVAGFAQLPATLHVTGKHALTFACACGAFIAVPVTVTAAGAGTVTVTMDGVMDHTTARLRFDPKTFVLERFDLPSQQLSIALTSHDAAPAAPASPVAPSPAPSPSRGARCTRAAAARSARAAA